MSLTLTSSAFNDRSAFPAKYTCDGSNVSPPLAILDAPAGAKSLVLVCDDPDAPGGSFVHWVLYDLPPATRSLPEGIPAFEVLRELGGARQGKTDYGRVGYGGPCPPPGKPHRYQFTLYALNTVLGLKGGPTKAEVERAMEGHVVAQARIVGTYQRGAR